MKPAVIIGLAALAVLLYGPVVLVVFFGGLAMLALLSSLNNPQDEG